MKSDYNSAIFALCCIIIGMLLGVTVGEALHANNWSSWAEHWGGLLGNLVGAGATIGAGFLAWRAAMGQLIDARRNYETAALRMDLDSVRREMLGLAAANRYLKPINSATRPTLSELSVAFPVGRSLSRTISGDIDLLDSEDHELQAALLNLSPQWSNELQDCIGDLRTCRDKNITFFRFSMLDIFERKPSLLASVARFEKLIVSLQRIVKEKEDEEQEILGRELIKRLAIEPCPQP